MHFSRYGNCREQLTLAQVLDLQRETQMLWAHAEESGCEGCYCEIARWNDETRRYERFLFEKFFGGEHPDKPDAGCVETAEYVAGLINEIGYGVSRSPIVHSLTSFGDLTELEAAAIKLSQAVDANPEKYRAFEFDSAFGAVCYAGGKLSKRLTAAQ